MNTLDMMLLMEDEVVEPVEPQEWYLTSDILESNVIGVWQPKGAIDLATSYNSLVGSKVLTTTSAPTWNSTDGWIFDGLTQYLSMDITPTVDTTVIIRYTISLLGQKSFFGGASADWVMFAIYLAEPEYTGQMGSSQSVVEEAPPLNGVIALNANGIYLNGTLKGIYDQPVTFTNTVNPLWIGGVYSPYSLYSTEEYAVEMIQAISLYNNKLSATQIASISAKMTLL